jgi:hypothetical protein
MKIDCADVSPSIWPDAYFNLAAGLAFRSTAMSRLCAHEQRHLRSSIRPHLASSSVHHHHHRSELQQERHVCHHQHQHLPRSTSTSSTDHLFLHAAQVSLPRQSTWSTVRPLLCVLAIFGYTHDYTELWFVTVLPHRVAALPHVVIDKP